MTPTPIDRMTTREIAAEIERQEREPTESPERLADLRHAYRVRMARR